MKKRILALALAAMCLLTACGQAEEQGSVPEDFHRGDFSFVEELDSSEIDSDFSLEQSQG